MSITNNNNDTGTAELSTNNFTLDSSLITSNASISDLNSPHQKDSGIDDCSPLSYEGGYIEQKTKSPDLAVCVYPPCPAGGQQPVTPQMDQFSVEDLDAKSQGI